MHWWGYYKYRKAKRALPAPNTHTSFWNHLYSHEAGKQNHHPLQLPSRQVPDALLFPACVRSETRRVTRVRSWLTQDKSLCWLKWANSSPSQIRFKSSMRGQCDLGVPTPNRTVWTWMTFAEHRSIWTQSNPWLPRLHNDAEGFVAAKLRE